MKSDEYHFRKDSGGRSVYFPWGIGKAYVLPDEAAKQRLGIYLKIRNSLGFLAVLILVLSREHIGLSLLSGLLLALGLEVIIFVVGNWLFFRNLEAVTDFSNADQIYQQIKAPPTKTTNSFVFWGSLAFVIAGVYLWSNGEKAIGLLSIGFFGLGLIVAIIQMLKRDR